MKKNNSRYFIFIVILLIFSLFPVNAYIYHQTNDYYQSTPLLSCGIDYNKFFISTSYQTQPYTTNLNTGVVNWNNDTIYFTQTTNYWESVCDVQVINSDDASYSRYSSLNGFTRVWVGDGPGASNNVYYEDSLLIPDDYFAGEVFINSKKVSSSNTSMTRSVTSHEVGHVLGLGHNSNSSSIMYLPTTATAPTTTDKGNVTQIYNYWGY